MTIDFSIYHLLLNKLRLLKQKGYEVWAVSSSGIYRERIEEAEIKVKYIEMSRRIDPLQDMRSIEEMRRFFGEEKFHIVHTHTAKAGVIGRIAAKRAKVPVILHTYHGLPFYQGLPFFKFFPYMLIEKWAAGSADFLLSQNREDFENIERYRLKSGDRCAYEGSGVNLEELTEEIMRADPEAVRDEFRIAKDEFLIGYFARFEPVKGHSLFLRALKSLKDEGRLFKVLFAGKGFMEKKIMGLVSELHLEGEVINAGFRQDLHRVMRGVDLLVLASRKEGLPRVIFEAMAASKPVVATDVLGTREVVVHNETGLLVPYGDSEALADAIAELMDSGELRLRLGRVGRERLEKQFDERVVAERIDDIYRKLLSEKGILVKPSDDSRGTKVE